jgi:lipopolysaccharide O-acetyltransferase
MISFIKNTFYTYGVFGILQLLFFKVRTKFLFSQARIVRFPIRIRGKKYISVGKGFTTGFNCRLDAYSNENNKITLNIGRNVQINDNVHIGAINSINIKDNVLIASKVFITDHNHGNYSGSNQDSPFIDPVARPLNSKPIIIEKNVWLGEYVCVLPGVRIGKGSIIGAMSVVNKDIPPHSIAVGSPARVIKVFNESLKIWEKV